MLASFFLVPAIAALAAANPLLKRDGAAIETAIGYIQSNLTQLNTSVSAIGYNDTIQGVVILFQTGDLQTSIQDATAVANASAPLTDAESGALAVTIVNLEPMIFSLLDNLVAHQPEFQTALFGGNADFLVKLNLQSSQTDTDALGSALTAKLTSAYAGAAPTIISQIDAAFTTAINTFSS